MHRRYWARAAVILLLGTLLGGATPAVADQTWATHDGVAIFEQGGRYGLLDAQGNVALPATYDEIAVELACDRRLVRQGGLCGYVDGTGQLVIPPQWPEASAFFAPTPGDTPFAEVFLPTGKRAYIDVQGQVVLTFADWMRNVSWAGEGLFLVEKDCGEQTKERNGTRYTTPLSKYGYVDRTGSVVIQPEWDQAGSFADGRAPVMKDGLVGYIDPTGALEVPLQYAWDFLPTYPEDPGSPGAFYQDKRWGLISTTGEVIVPAQYDDIFLFHDGLCPVQKGGKWGAIDRAGNLVVDFAWQEMGLFFEGLAPVRKGGKWGFIDDHGKVVFKPQWAHADRFSDGLAPVQAGKKWGYIDHDGKLAIAPSFDEAFPFVHGIARVVQKGRWLPINTEGDLLSGLESK